MGNKQRASKVESKSTPKSAPKPTSTSKPTKPAINIEYTIVPESAKFNKIDLVKYGQIFDEYKVPQPIETAIKQIHLSKEKWYLDSQIRHRINDAFGSDEHLQFPLRKLLRFAVTYNQNELVEFICTQELIECLHWDRDFFLSQIFDIIPWSSKVMKLSAINVIASYMIPERINLEDFKKIISDEFKNRWNFNTDEQRQKYEDLCQGMVEEGMNGRAQRIIQTRNALRNNIGDDFPNELIRIVIVFAFGMTYKH